MEIVEVKEKTIRGFMLRTSNEREMNPELKKIPDLWETFFQHAQIQKESQVYGVYYNYQSDMSGQYSLLAGADFFHCSSSITTEEVKITKGRYLVFHAKGQVPQAVVETWKTIWEYFSKEDTKFERAYTTDFELYNENGVTIYIALK